MRVFNKRVLCRVWREDSGQDIVEYALIAALISLIALSTLESTGPLLSNAWNNISNTIAGAA